MKNAFQWKDGILPWLMLIILYGPFFMTLFLLSVLTWLFPRHKALRELSGRDY